MFVAIIVVVGIVAPCLVFHSIPLIQLQLHQVNFARKMESKSTQSDCFCSLAAKAQVSDISSAYGFDLGAKKSGSPTWEGGGVVVGRNPGIISAGLISARSQLPQRPDH